MSTSVGTLVAVIVMPNAVKVVGDVMYVRIKTGMIVIVVPLTLGHGELEDCRGTPCPETRTDSSSDRRALPPQTAARRDMVQRKIEVLLLIAPTTDEQHHVAANR